MLNISLSTGAAPLLSVQVTIASLNALDRYRQGEPQSIMEMAGLATGVAGKGFGVMTHGDIVINSVYTFMSSGISNVPDDR